MDQSPPPRLVGPTPPRPISADELLNKLVHTRHFILSSIAIVAHIIVTAGVIPVGTWLRLVTGLAVALQAAGYLRGAFWSPPRAEWDDKQRNSYYRQQLEESGYRVLPKLPDGPKPGQQA